MKRFKNILVGVDLSQADRYVSDLLPEPTVEAVERAIWLAKMNSARLTFFYSLDVPASAQHEIQATENGDPDVLDLARDALNTLKQRASAESIEADIEVDFGKTSIALIKRVIRADHDLLVAGTRHLSSFKSLILGSTGIKLLRKCPCPVWITMPQSAKKIKSILVAHCLREVGDTAMELGCSMAELQGAKLFVVHSLESKKLSHDELRQRREEAETKIAAQLSQYQFATEPDVHIVSDPPEVAVLREIEEHNIELLTMGTVARSGIAGLLTGNTAERLLPQIPCSVMAVKPRDFVSPVAP